MLLHETHLNLKSNETTIYKKRLSLNVIKMFRKHFYLMLEYLFRQSKYI